MARVLLPGQIGDEGVHGMGRQVRLRIGLDTFLVPSIVGVLGVGRGGSSSFCFGKRFVMTGQAEPCRRSGMTLKTEN